MDREDSIKRQQPGDTNLSEKHSSSLLLTLDSAISSLKRLSAVRSQ
jgi:hypothetical protein